MKAKFRRTADISVVIPVYNHRPYLNAAIESVWKQTLRPSEVIVVDDGSTDGSGEFARGIHPGIKLFRQANQGIGAARNKGIEHASSEYLGFLDADDLWSPDKLERQMEAFASDPDLDLVFGHVEQFLSPDLDDESKRLRHCPEGSMPGYLAGAMLVKKEAFLRVGFFKTEIKIGEFVDWYTRAQEKGLKQKLIKDTVLRRRIHGMNQGIREKKSQKDYLKVLKAALDRRRTVGNSTS